MILVLQVAAIAEPQDLHQYQCFATSSFHGPSHVACMEWYRHEQARLHRKKVAPRLQEVGDLKLGGQAAVLAVAQQLAVQPGVHRIVHGVKAQERPAQHQPLLYQT